MSRKTVANDKRQKKEDDVLNLVEKLGSATVEQVMEALNLTGPAERRAVQRRLNSLHQQAHLRRYLDTTSPHRRYIYYPHEDKLVIPPKVRIKDGEKRPTIIQKNIASAYRIKANRARRFMATGITGAIIRRTLKGRMSKERFGSLYSHESKEITPIVRQHLKVTCNAEPAYEGDIYWILAFTAFQYMEREIPVKTIDLHLSLDVEGMLQDLTNLTLSKYAETAKRKQVY